MTPDHRENIAQIFVLLSVLIAAPMLLLCASSDHYVTNSLFTQILLYPRGGYGLLPVICYVAAIFLTRKRVSLKNTVQAIFSTVVAVFVVWVFSLPFYVSLAYHPNTSLALLVHAVVVLLKTLVVTYVVRVLVSSSVPLYLETIGHFSVLALPNIIWWALGYLGYSAYAHFFGLWPILLMLLPYAGAVFLYRDKLPDLRCGAMVVAITLAPIYFTKMFDELAFGRHRPLTWPYRIASEFVTPDEHKNYVERLNNLEKNEPIRIGQHWYKFQEFKKYHTRIPYEPRPDRLSSLRITIPTDRLGLPASAGTEPGWIDVNIVASIDSPLRPYYSTVYSEDIYIRIGSWKPHPNWPSDKELKSRLQKYISEIRVISPSKGTEND